MKRVVLLDLNATYVENTREAHNLPYTYNVSKERYRTWLTKKLRHAPCVVMMTSRPEYLKDETLAHILRLEGWLPDDAYFNEWRIPAEEAKEKMMKKYVIPRYGKHNDRVSYFALESNHKTSRMYDRVFGIPSVRQQEFQKTGFASADDKTGRLFNG